MTYSTPQQRQAALRAIIAALPEPKNADRLRRVAAALHIQPNTVRGWLLQKPHRHVSERQLALLRDALTK